jgi:hypothetical protein
VLCFWDFKDVDSLSLLVPPVETALETSLVVCSITITVDVARCSRKIVGFVFESEIRETNIAKACKGNRHLTYLATVSIPDP